MTDRKLEIVLSAREIGTAAFAKVEGRIRSITRRVTSFQGVLAGLAGGYTLKTMAEELLQVGLRAEAMEIGLAAATGSAEKAAEAQEYLRSESERLGLVLVDQVDAYKQLAAASKGTNLEGERTEEIYTAVAEAGTALRLSQDQMRGSLYAVTQMISKGKVSAEELRQQLGERLPGAYQIAARAMDVTTGELSKMLEQGELMSDEFLPRFAKELRRTFAGDLTEAVQGSQANINRLKNTFYELETTITGSGVMETFNEQVQNVNKRLRKWLETNEELIRQRVPEYIDDIGESLERTVAVYNSLPEGVVGAAGYGIVGRIIFGAGPGKLIAAIALIKSQFDGLVDSVKQRYPGLYEERMAKFEAFVDRFTGDQNLQRRASELRKEIENIQLNPIQTEAHKQRLAELRKELEEVNREIEAVGLAALDIGRGTSFPGPSTSRGGNTPIEKAMGLDRETKDKIDDALDGYISQYGDYIRKLQEIDREYLTARDRARGDYYFDPEAARFAGGKGQEAYAEELIDNANKAGDAMKDMARDASWSMSSAFASFFDVTSDGFLKLESLATGISQSIARAFSDNLARSIVGGVGGDYQAASGLLGWLFNAKGNVFSNGHLQAFARGGVVNRPTVFPFASGVGLMGEAGPEAIMPLTRTPGGDLGVRAQGGGVTIFAPISAVDAESFHKKMKRDGAGAITEVVVENLMHNSTIRSMIMGTT